MSLDVSFPPAIVDGPESRRRSPRPAGLYLKARTMPYLEDDPLVLLSDVSRHMRTYADQLAQAHGMTRAQLIILARLQMQPDLTQN